MGRLLETYELLFDLLLKKLTFTVFDISLSPNFGGLTLKLTFLCTFLNYLTFSA